MPPRCNAAPVVDAPLLADIPSIREIVRSAAARAGIAGAEIATIPAGDGTPYIEVDAAYRFVVEERGIELERRSTCDLDELLYWILDTISFSAACDWELRYRREGEDARRQLFARQQALLAAMAPDWARRKAAEHARILLDHPYDDRLD